MKGVAHLAMILVAGLAASVFAPPRANAHSKPRRRSITLNFDYNFTKRHSCDTPPNKECVKQFNVYDISGNKPYLLFTIPAPSGAVGPVKGIKAASPELDFEKGTHWLGVTAQTAEGGESDPHACRIAVKIR